MDSDILRARHCAVGQLVCPEQLSVVARRRLVCVRWEGEKSAMAHSLGSCLCVSPADMLGLLVLIGRSVEWSVREHLLPP